LENSYPDASSISIVYSVIDFSTSASNTCVIIWTISNNNCSYKVFSYIVGKTAVEAMNKAIEHKSDWNIANTDYWMKKAAI
jgi:hypothetical protein